MRIAPSKDRWGVMESWNVRSDDVGTRPRRSRDGMAGKHAKPELRERARCLLLNTGYEIA